MKKNGFISEFKAFVMRGNVLDMAIGVIVATAFGKITTSLINDVLLPLIGFIIGDINLSQFNIVLSPAQMSATGEVVKEAVVIGIGTFISSVINFVLIAFIVFMIIKVMNAAKKKEEPAIEAPKGPTSEELLSQILVELKNK